MTFQWILITYLKEMAFINSVELELELDTINLV
jgi:hypothetical protein